MLSIADYVKSRGVSQTAVRRQLKRYSKELDGHIIETSRRKMLDDFAVSFLDSHRMPREVIIEQADDQARKEVEDLRSKLDLMKDELLHLREMYSEIQKRYIEAQEKYIEFRENQIPILEDRSRLQQENQSLKDRAETAEAEVNSFEKSIFGFYRKKK